jgi:perosamine synthetase
MSPLGARVAQVFVTTPRLQFSAQRSDVELVAWQREVRLLVRRGLDALDEVTAEPTREWRIGALLARQLLFRSAVSVRCGGTLLRPERAEPLGAILILPGRHAVHAQVIGAEPADYPERNVAQRLTALGFTTLTLDYGLRHVLSAQAVARDGDETRVLAQALALSGRSLMGCLAADAWAALHWLEHAGGKTQGLGVLGHGLGGHVALHAALAYERRVPLVLASCAAFYRSLFWRELSGGGAHALPGILQHVDFPDLAAAHAPGWLQMQQGETDDICPLADAREIQARVKAAFRVQDVEGQCDAALLPMGHAVDASRAADFLSAAIDLQSRELFTTVPAARLALVPEVRREILDRVDNALMTGTLTHGPVCNEFELAMAAVTGAPDAVAVNSGTSALEIALRVIDVAGKTVLIPANTSFATAAAALAAGADIDFVDMEAEGFGADPDAIATKLPRGRIGAVVVVHVGGIISPRVPEIRALCQRHGVPLVEDAAHALGSTLAGRPAGSFGRLAAFSFHSTKVVTSAEGGAVVAHDSRDLAVARTLRDHGRIATGKLHGRVGGSWRLSEVHAAIGLVQIERLETYVAQRRSLAAEYDARLRALPGLAGIAEPVGVFSNYYKYIARLGSSVDREALRTGLWQRHRVELSGELYDPLCCLQPVLEGRFDAAQFPVALEFSQRHVCLPIYPSLTRAEQRRVAEALEAEVPQATRETAARRPFNSSMY